MTSSQKPLRVSIIGGGPAGLTLARILQETTSPAELHITVYDRDESRSSRTQGGTLDLHDETGLRALKAAGLIEEFKKYARPEGDQTRVYDMHGLLRYDGISSPPGLEDVQEVKGKPEIDRMDLRAMLVDSIHPQSIRWGHHLVSLQPLPSSTANEYELTFSSGEKVITDLVIGADGAWSRVRTHLNPNAIPHYCGFSSFDLRITNVDVRYPELSKTLGNGMAIFLGDRKTFFVQRNNYGKVNVVTYLRKDVDWLDQFKDLEMKVLKERIIEQYEGYDDKIMDFVRAADDDIVLRKLHALPLSAFTYPSNPSVTVIGDAAHLMSPFAGEGVNLAMADAADLATELSRLVASRSKPNSGLTLPDVLDSYAKAMVKRALPAGKESADNLELCNEEDAVELMARFTPLFDARYQKGFPIKALMGFVPWFIWRSIRRFFARLV